MANAIRPRLEPDVVKLVKVHAAANGRNPPGEVNHALRRYYSGDMGHMVATGKNAKVKGLTFIPASK